MGAGVETRRALIVFAGRAHATVLVRLRRTDGGAESDYCLGVLRHTAELFPRDIRSKAVAIPHDALLHESKVTHG